MNSILKFDGTLSDWCFVLLLLGAWIITTYLNYLRAKHAVKVASLSKQEREDIYFALQMWQEMIIENRKNLPADKLAAYLQDLDRILDKIKP